MAERDCDLPSPLALPPADDFPALPMMRMRVKNAAWGQHAEQYLFRSGDPVNKPNMPYNRNEIHTMIVHRNALVSKDVVEEW